MKVYTEVIVQLLGCVGSTTYPKQVHYFEHMHDRMCVFAMCICTVAWLNRQNDVCLQCMYGCMVVWL